MSHSTDIAIRRQVILERLKAGYARDYAKTVDEIVREVSALLHDLDYETLKEMPAREFNALLATALTVTGERMRDRNEEFSEEMDELAESESKAEVALLALLLGSKRIKAPTDATSYARNRAVESSGTLAKTRLADLARSETRQMEGVLRGARTGDAVSISETVRRLRGTRRNDFKDSLYATQAKRRAGVITASNVQHFSGSGRLSTWLANNVREYVWISVLDARTTAKCQGLSEKVFKVGNGPIPPIHENCLTGDALITSSHGISNAFKRAFKGEVFTIKTRSGNEVTVTPNHPILTRGGWVPAKVAEIGLECAVQSNVESVVSVDGDDYRVGARIEDIFESLRTNPDMVSREVPVSAPDFHGDAVDNEVAVVLSNSNLSLIRYSIEVEHSAKCSLVSGDRVVVLGSCLSRLSEFCVGLDSSLGSGVSSGSKCLDLRGSGSLHPSKLLFGSVSNMDSILNEDPLYGSWADTEHICDTSDTNSRGVFFDNIVSVERSDFCGHVYNLETDTHCVNANGFITHNCRSTVSMLPVGEKPVEAESYYSWIQRQPVAFQERAMGKKWSKLLRKGGMSADQFASLRLDRNFDPITLKEAQAISPELFVKADVEI